MAKKESSLLELVFEFWADFGKKSADRAKKAIADIEHEKYTFSRLVRDAFAVPSDAIGAWMLVTGMTKKRTKK